jgi:hypothetical protein
MGVNANITVYGWRKPTLELELLISQFTGGENQRLSLNL